MNLKVRPSFVGRNMLQTILCFAIGVMSLMSHAQESSTSFLEKKKVDEEEMKFSSRIDSISNELNARLQSLDRERTARIGAAIQMAEKAYLEKLDRPYGGNVSPAVERDREIISQRSIIEEETGVLEKQIRNDYAGRMNAVIDERQAWRDGLEKQREALRQERAQEYEKARLEEEKKREERRRQEEIARKKAEDERLEQVKILRAELEALLLKEQQWARTYNLPPIKNPSTKSKVPVSVIRNAILQQTPYLDRIGEPPQPSSFYQLTTWEEQSIQYDLQNNGETWIVIGYQSQWDIKKEGLRNLLSFKKEDLEPIVGRPWAKSEVTFVSRNAHFIKGGRIRFLKRGGEWYFKSGY